MYTKSNELLKETCYVRVEIHKSSVKNWYNKQKINFNWWVKVKEPKNNSCEEIIQNAEQKKKKTKKYKNMEGS